MATKKKPKADASSVIRAAGYSRTSGEGQRDNTSIPRQRDAIEAYCKLNGWEFVGHYVDESKSGSKEEGRDEFQRMMRDAALGKFDMVVVFDIKRFSRDGADIIRNATFLRSNFNIHVVDTKNQFDTRDRRKTLINYVHAGVSEQERLDIMERMIGGRIRKAQDGLPWCGHKPMGRDFRRTSKNQGEWYITERGEKLRELLTRYANGERLNELVKQYGFSSPHVVLFSVRESQLSAKPFVVTFNAPEIDIVDLQVAVPAIPQVISPTLEKKVRERMEHNRSWNKENLRKYLLTGYTFCGKCGCALTSAFTDGHTYYRHHRYTANTPECGFHSIRGDEFLESHVLDYLYSFFIDRPAFEEAVKKSMPSPQHRKDLEGEVKKATDQLAKVNKSIANLVDAISNGADVGLLLAKQEGLKAEREVAAARLVSLQAELATLPDASYVAQQADLLRLQLAVKHTGKDWRKLPYDEIRQFLKYLFGSNTKKTGKGIFRSLHRRQVARHVQG